MQVIYDLAPINNSSITQTYTENAQQIAAVAYIPAHAILLLTSTMKLCTPTTHRHKKPTHLIYDLCGTQNA